MSKIFFILLILVILGCQSQPVCEPEIQYQERIVYKDRVIEKEVHLNKTCQNQSNSDNYTTSYVLNLIRQVKWCEAKLETNWSYIELENRLNECNNSLNKLKEVFEEVK